MLFSGRHEFVSPPDLQLRVDRGFGRHWLALLEAVVKRHLVRGEQEQVLLEIEIRRCLLEGLVNSWFSRDTLPSRLLLLLRMRILDHSLPAELL